MKTQLPKTERPNGDQGQSELVLERDGILVYRWRMAYGEILIEVFRDKDIKVNGEQIGRE